MSDVVHLVVGPHDEHGVVRHGREIAEACGHRMLRVATVDGLGSLPPCAVVHLPFTDRLLAHTAEAAADAVDRVASLAAAAGASLSVTLHDVPHDDSPLQQRRRAAYDRVVAAARGVVVSSGVELALVEDRADGVHSLRLIPLPLLPAGRPFGTAAPVAPGSVGVLGFVFPDRGYEHVIAALAPDTPLVALGRPAAGHEDLPGRYARLAGGRFRVTGYVPDDELATHLDAVAVPVAPNPRVTASASINTWIAHGRRPLVPDSPYARELLRERPEALALYDRDDPEDLRTRIAAALTDPSRTRVPDGAHLGPTLADTAARYREHLEACRPPAAVDLGRGPVVPGNRWDLLPDVPRVPSVSVVVPHYDGQHDLDLVLAALARQTHRELEIVVADDGSPHPPSTAAAGDRPVRVVAQDDRGFRAAAARNLGARAARGDVLVFLDGDTVPEPDFVERLAARAAAGADVLAVGRRRHADLSSARPDDLDAFFASGPDRRFPELDEPGWLRDAYRTSADLLHADRRSYRFVISAVLAVGAPLFRRLGGFDERFVGYGGEDWEFAARAWNAGAVLVHEPRAVAWHDGPDWAARAGADDRRAVKDVETTALATLLPDPDSRGAGQWQPYPSVIVRGGRLTDVEALATVRSAFAAGADCAFFLDGVTGPHAELVTADPRVRLGAPPDDVAARAWCHAALHAPADLGDLMALAGAAERHGTVAAPAITLTSARARARSTHHVTGDPDALAAYLFGRHDRSRPASSGFTDLAGHLRSLR